MKSQEYEEILQEIKAKARKKRKIKFIGYMKKSKKLGLVLRAEDGSHS